MRLGLQTITVNVPTSTTVDRLGSDMLTYRQVTVTNCSVQEHQTHRNIELTEVVEARWVLFAPASAPIAVNTPVQINNVTYIVDGEPIPWHDKGGRPHHIQCYLKQQAG